MVTVRILPLAPFGMVSYAFGASGVRLRAYLVGTVLGMLPATAVYVNLGAASTRPGSSAACWSGPANTSGRGWPGAG